MWQKIKQSDAGRGGKLRKNAALMLPIYSNCTCIRHCRVYAQASPIKNRLFEGAHLAAKPIKLGHTSDSYLNIFPYTSSDLVHASLRDTISDPYPFSIYENLMR